MGTLMDCSSSDLASKDFIYKILTRENKHGIHYSFWFHFPNNSINNTSNFLQVFHAL